MTVAIVSCLQLPEPDVDEELLMGALAEAGVDALLVAWDDASVNWSEFTCVILRSPWNYITQLDEFLAWAGEASRTSSLFNPLPVVEWNTHKGYLRDLATRGIPIVPTAWVGAGAGSGLAELMVDNGWTDVVAKPVVGAGSYLTDRITEPGTKEAQRFWAALCEHGEVMVQPYMQSVEEYGERSIMWIDGEFTHAIRKSPRLGDAEESVSEALPIADDELQLSRRIIDGLEDDLLYARIDLIRDADGQPLLAELELVEPSLFLRQSPAALERLVTGIKERS